MSAWVLGFDVETVATRNAGVIARLCDEAVAKRPPAGAKGKVRDLWDTFEERAKRGMEAVRVTSLDVTLAEVCCVCWAEGDGEIIKSECGADEGAILEELAREWDCATEVETVWGGHNVEGYDLAVLLNGWRRHGIRPPRHFPVYSRGRWRGRVYDSMLRIPTKTGFISLERACEMVGIEMREILWQGEAVDGSRVAELVDAGAWGCLVEYCREDVRAWGELFGRLTSGGTWGTFDWTGVMDEVTALRAATGLSEGARALAIVGVLERAKVI